MANPAGTTSSGGGFSDGKLLQGTLILLASDVQRTEGKYVISEHPVAFRWCSEAFYA